MAVPNYYDFVSKKVVITVKRRGKVKEHRGVLVSFYKNGIELRNDRGKTIWCQRPDYFRDSIKEIL